MKRVVVCFLLLCLSLVLCACGGTGQVNGGGS